MGAQSSSNPFQRRLRDQRHLNPIKISSSQYKGPKKYIVDTGAPIDAVGRNNLPAKDLQRIEQGDHSIEFETANGVTIANQTIRYDLQGRLSETINPMVLENTPICCQSARGCWTMDTATFGNLTVCGQFFLNLAHTINSAWISEPVSWKAMYQCTTTLLQAKIKSKLARHGHSHR